MSEQPEQDAPAGPEGEQAAPPPPREAPVAGGSDDGPPAQGEGEPDSY